MSDNVSAKIYEINTKIKALRAKKDSMKKTDPGNLAGDPQYIAYTNTANKEIDAEIQKLGNELTILLSQNQNRGGKRKSRRVRKISNTRKQKRSKQHSKKRA
jgi:hypothetical protein